MADAFSTGLLLPAICLAALGWAVPRVLAVWWPEGVKWLIGLAFASTFVMALSGAAFFAILYASQGIKLDDLWETGGLSVPIHFAKLSLISALLWAPLMVLSLIGVPKNWVREVW
ncbi:hypothetical protein L0664_07945 [Octadecabacter sp. G9-8]|uniref:Uncharacterized protein n=1 Tax=Octadecabacter dasysiphoniae TaxID=2909341 RepID=A0ABS9CUS0_9RHOB|nr:hypothetical protein [Octadecabacter dasysiphoniae]MCF2870994.1 hypothetical protein [Octadecabacter dasysiphoniae]